MKRLWGLFSLFGFVLLALCLFSGTSLQAQATATLHGTVTDASGAAVPKATVTARNEATGIAWTTETNEGGNYLIPALPAGVYRIEITREGFQKHVVTGLKLDVASSVEQNVRLKVGELSQQVVITGETPVIDTSTMTVGQVINHATVQEIPLNGRHIEELIQLAPGSVTPPQNGFLTAPLRGQGSFGAVTAGNREDTVNFLVNGINLNDMVQNQTTFQPSINTVEEFKLLNDTLSSEYGHTSGSVMSVATRSGTNDWHGEAFEFFRNNALDARHFFNPRTRINPITGQTQFNPQNAFKRNNFGGNFGGPIGIPGVGRVRNAFFFYSFEGLRQRQEEPFNTRVPTAAERATVSDPSGVAQKLLPLIPLPNAANPITGRLENFVGAGSAPVDINQNTLDVFLKLTASDTLHAYYARQRDDRHEPSAPVSFATIPDFGDIRSGRRQLLTINEAHTFSPSVANEFRFGGNRIKIKFGNLDTHNPADFGFVGQTPGSLPEIFIQATNLDFGGGGLAFPQGRADTTYVWADTLSWLRGNHSWKFGTEIRRFFNNNFTNPVGLFIFADIGPFLAGTPSEFRLNQGGNFSSIGTGSYMLFVQDNYKMLSNFTWELGFRYELNTTPTERFNRFVVFDPASDSLREINVSGIDQIYDTANNFEPRVGFAWDPFRDGKTSLRAGYGILFDQPVTNSVTGLAANPPFINPVRITSTPTSPINFANPFLGSPTTSPLSPSSINPAFKNPYVQEWNLNLQRAFTPTLGVTIGYFGSKGTHLRLARNVNQPVAGVRPFPRVTLVNGTTRAANVITEIASVGNSNYNALWISAHKRVSHGLQFLASYTYSHSIDYNSLNSQGIVIQDSTNAKGDRGASDFDARHRFVTSLIYDLPFRGKKAVLPAHFVEGWSLTGIGTLQTGNPLRITLAGVSPLTNVPGTVRPNMVGDPSVPNEDPSNFFNPLAFARPPAGHFGNLGRNRLVVGPPFENLDFSIRKITSLTERVKLEFRTEFFNIFNHPNFGQPNAICNPSSAAFTVDKLPGTTFPAGTCRPNASFGTIRNASTGAIISPVDFGVIRSTRNPPGDAGSARQVQFALKLQF